MSAPLRLGAVVPHHELAADHGAIRDYAQGVEALGVDHLLIYDHVVGAPRDRTGGFDGPYDVDTGFHEPLVFLSFVAALTTTVDLVTGILILPQRQTVLVAKQVAELAVLSDNRFELGIGVGVNRVEFDALGEDFGTRGRRQEEQVDLMRRLWTERVVTYDGEFHAFEEGGILPRPSQPIPVLFGGSAPAALDRCARLGDGWIPLGSPNEKSVARVAELRRRREAAGRSWDGFEIRAQAQYRGGTPERWRDHAAAWRRIGATHLAIATHNAGPTDVDGHLARIGEYRDAVTG